MTTLLTVLTKDCAEKLDRCLRSATHLVDDILVMDTGSTDDTIRVAYNHGARVISRPWVGFTHNRNEMLEAARYSADRLLILDSDEVIEGELPTGDRDCYRAMLHHGTYSYRWPFIVNARKPWEWRGVIHEALYCDEKFTMEDTDLFSVTTDGGGSRLAYDRAKLEEAGAGDTRNLFYLAQTYRDLGEIDLAIAHYKARAELGGYEEERWHALYQAGSLLCAHRSFLEGQEYLIRAWELRPTRAEPLRALATSAMNVADGIPFPAGDALFIEPSAYAEPMVPPDAV